MANPAAGSLVLSPRQGEVLEFIVGHVRDHGYPPSLREIGAALQIGSTSGVVCHLDALVRKGRLRRTGRASRGLAVIEVPGAESEVDRLRRQRDELLVACEAFSVAGASSWAFDPSLPDMVACPGCGIVSSRDAEKHTQVCPRMAARKVAEKIRAEEASRGR